MNVRSAVVYTVLRLAAFLVPFGLLMLLPIGREFYWLSAIFAALIGLSLSVLFLRRPLDDVSAGLAARRADRPSTATDEDVEDAAADAVRADAAASVADTADTADVADTADQSASDESDADSSADRSA